jgi:hypothetical protein
MIPHAKHIEKAYAALHCAKFVRRATVFVTEKLTVRLTRQSPHTKRARYENFVLSVGAPNYREREFIRLCRKAGETFAVKKVQLDFWPKKRKK